MKRMMLCLLALLFIFPMTAFAEAPAADLQVGDIVTMGQYEQDGKPENGTEPIDWIVLDVDTEGNKALVISMFSLDRLLYHSKYEPVTWETCDLRAQLNGEFLETVFTEEEIARIAFAQLHTPDNTSTGMVGGSDTTDRIFLLSAEEADRYFTSDEARKGIPSTYLGQLCIYTNGLEYTSTIWWLRTPGDTQAHAAYVFAGRVSPGGWAGNMHKLPIRPAMWITLDAE